MVAIYPLRSDIDIRLEVNILMKVSDSKDDGLPTFSNHVLRVDICGPQEDHSSVIDVPEIFRNVILREFTREGLRLMHDMVQADMKNSRSYHPDSDAGESRYSDPRHCRNGPRA